MDVEEELLEAVEEKLSWPGPDVGEISGDVPLLFGGRLLLAPIRYPSTGSGAVILV